jgi:hypothetical protein
MHIVVVFAAIVAAEQALSAVFAYGCRGESFVPCHHLRLRSRGK